MRVRVTNKRPVSVVIGGRSFRPRSSTELEVDTRALRQIRSRYGLIAEELVDVVTRVARTIDPADAPTVYCAPCERSFASASGLKSHNRAKHEEF